MIYFILMFAIIGPALYAYAKYFEHEPFYLVASIMAWMVALLLMIADIMRRLPWM